MSEKQKKKYMDKLRFSDKFSGSGQETAYTIQINSRPNPAEIVLLLTQFSRSSPDADTLQVITPWFSSEMSAEPPKNTMSLADKNVPAGAPAATHPVRRPLFWVHTYTAVRDAKNSLELGW